MPRSPNIAPPLVLPAPGATYDQENERETRRLITQAMQRSLAADALASLTPYAETILAAADAADARDVLDLGALALRDDVTEAQLTLADVTTADTTTTRHGLAPKLPGDASLYLDGTGAWSTPAGGGSALPTFPTISNLEVRLSAALSAITVSNSGRVDHITDISGNDRHFQSSSTRRPRYVKHGFAGVHPALWFNGAEWLKSVNTLTIPQPLTVVTVVSHYQGGSNNENLYRDSNLGAVGFIASGSNFAIFAGSNIVQSATLFSENRAVLPPGVTALPMVRQDIYQGTSSFMRVNGTEGPTPGTTPGTSGISGTLSVMSDGSTSFAKGFLYEFLIFSKALDSTERAALEAYYAEAAGVVV